MKEARKVGFTGTQNGMTEMQSQFVFNAMMDLDPIEFHHGCCIGADAQADDMAGYLPNTCKVIGHPPEDQDKMADCSCDEFREARPYLDRNKDIVDETDLMIAAPDGPERLRSGTWSTVRYARKNGKRVYLVWPSGETTWWGE